MQPTYVIQFIDDKKSSVYCYSKKPGPIKRFFVEFLLNCSIVDYKDEFYEGSNYDKEEIVYDIYLVEELKESIKKRG